MVAPDRHDCIVVGAGPAGLASAATLQATGLKVLVVERGANLAPSWRARYDGFRLNTSSWFSYLPGMRFERGVGRWPSRDDLVDYYERYAATHDLMFEFGCDVLRVEPGAGSQWLVLTGSRDFTARHVVIATGKYRTPQVPDWPGSDGFGGQLIHSSAYRNATPYAGQRPLVVGPGNSGFEIAIQLAHAGCEDVALSVRTPPHLIHRDIGPIPSDLFAVMGRRLPVSLVDRLASTMRRISIGSLAKYGLANPSDGLYSRLRRTGMIPTIDGRFIEALRARQVRIVGAVDSFDGNQVVLVDGTRLARDLVVAATGYRRDLEPMVGHLGALDEEGRPRFNGRSANPSFPGLRFIGFSEPLSGNLREIRLDAKRLALSILAEDRSRR